MRHARTFIDTSSGAPISLFAEEVVAWSPMATRQGTHVRMTNGHAHRVTTPFREFHSWVIAPGASEHIAKSPEPAAKPVSKHDLNGRTPRK